MIFKSLGWFIWILLSESIILGFSLPGVRLRSFLNAVIIANIGSAIGFFVVILQLEALGFHPIFVPLLLLSAVIKTAIELPLYYFVLRKHLRLHKIILRSLLANFISQTCLSLYGF